MWMKAITDTHTDAAKEKLMAENKKLKAEAQNKDEELARSKAEVARLQEANRRAARFEAPRINPEPSSSSSSRELETTKKKLLQVEAALSNSRDEVAKLNHSAAKQERRINELLSQLSSLSASASNSHSNDRRGKARARDDLSTDVFDNRLDQVSEAVIKSGVDDLNDSIMSFVTDVLEAADGVVAGHPIAHPIEPFEDSDRPLFLALMQDQLTTDSRGLLLDATFHDQLNVELYELFFSSDVAPVRIDPTGLVQKVFEQLASKESWTVAQRWRALAATGLSTLISDASSSSILDLASRLVKLLAWAHGLTPSDFESLKTTSILPKLRTLFNEAENLAIRARRDVLSVRMSIITLSLNSPPSSSTLYDPRDADLVWPDMGIEKGDEVVGRYKFGLKRLGEDGVRLDYLVKPQVTTTALVRETSKSC
ncbi:hypothetical protein FB45DRAFT_358217 [Roridomyces roridus]|uniref:Uncharacterized protein n=1 Tax=Roridomyces roridus TaxID=1738132 RepID=A0AAD7FVI4_9AGAR|nr:hypothetical protein FB45DRAFT_358217 [Roridomyces roridus]